MDRFPPVSATPARIALAVPALILLTVIGWLNYHSRQKLLEIARDGVETHGEIVGKYCSNHGEMSYSFAVNERKFYGSGFCPVDCNKVAIGFPISVTYARHNPANSRCDTAEQAESRPNGNYTMLIIIAIGLTVVIFRITRNR
jgi:hypothetical protein